jgi:nucleotide-binding universal stress UspA family protein
MNSQRKSRHRRTILIPLDGSALSERVLHHLDLVLRRSTGDVVLLQIVGPYHPGVLMRGDDAAAFRSVIRDREQAQRYLERVKHRLTRRNIRSRVLVRTGDPITEIVKCSRTERVDLVLMSTHGRRGIRRALMGSVAENVVRGASMPILLVPARAG